MKLNIQSTQVTNRPTVQYMMRDADLQHEHGRSWFLYFFNNKVNSLSCVLQHSIYHGSDAMTYSFGA